MVSPPPSCFANLNPTPSGAHGPRLDLSRGDAQHGLTPPDALLMSASHMVVPVNKVALRVVPPRPDVKLEKRRYVEPVWTVDVKEHLTFQNGRTGIVLQPGRSEGNEFDADQLHLTVRGRFVDQGLRMVDVDHSVQQVAIDVVDAHGTVVRTADATEEGLVSLSGGVVDVDVLLRRLANHLDELVLTPLSCWLHLVLSHSKRSK